NPVHFPKQLAPVSEQRLVFSELEGEPLVVAKLPNEVGFGAGLDHSQLIVGDILGPQALDFRVDRVANLSGSVAGSGHGEEDEKAWILVAGEIVEPAGEGGDFLVAHQRAVKPRRAP